MVRSISVLAATGLVLLGSSIFAGASVGSKPSNNGLTVVAVLGPKVSVPPGGKFGISTAKCPKGYYVTGGGDFNGVLTVIASAPEANLHGWFADDQNTAPANGGKVYTHRADAVCVKGSATVSIALRRAL